MSTQNTNKHDVEIARIRAIARIVVAIVAGATAVGLAIARVLPDWPP